MANIILPPRWRIPDREATPESVYFNRRAFLRSAGAGIAAVGLGACGSEFTPVELDDEPTGSCNDPITHPLQALCTSPNMDLHPAARNESFVIGEALTDRLIAAQFNNYYEFIQNSGDVNRIWPYTGPFQVWPWIVEVTGLAEVTGTFDVADFEREFGLEERTYRHRCVERWSIRVPWTGYPLAKLVQKFRPLSSANYVRFVSFNRPDEAVGQRSQADYPWPYFEGLRMDEALNELAFVVTGVYGEPLPKQHGAAVAPGDPLEVRIQKREGDGSHRVHERGAADVLDGLGAHRVRLLLKREPARPTPEVVTGFGGAAGNQHSDRDEALQRVRAVRSGPLRPWADDLHQLSSRVRRGGGRP